MPTNIPFIKPGLTVESTADSEDGTPTPTVPGISAKAIAEGYQISHSSVMHVSFPVTDQQVLVNLNGTFVDRKMLADGRDVTDQEVIDALKTHHMLVTQISIDDMRRTLQWFIHKRRTPVP